MVRNYFKLAWRNLAKNSTHSIIIISGLVLAYSACLAIFLFVENETSYDRQSPDAARIFRVAHNNIDDDGTSFTDATTPSAFAPLLVHDISQIESVVRIEPTWSLKLLVKGGGKAFYEGRIMGVDSNFVQFFGLKVLAGNPNLDAPNKTIITGSVAKKYFGKTDAVGETLLFETAKTPLIVAAVVEDLPPNMHFHFNIFVPLWLPGNPDQFWDTYNYFTYIKLKDGVNIAGVDPQIQQVFEKHRPNRLHKFFTQPITDIHLHSHMRWELEPNGDEAFVTIFITIGLFIFLIATVNYINLSIVQALNRSKEVGIRKVSGAQAPELINQFLLESMAISVASMIVAVGLLQALVPFINAMFGQHLRPLLSLPFWYTLVIIMFSVAAGILSGLYPAFYLSAFKPAAVLKGIFQPGNRNAWLRKSLVVLQFAISIALITGAILVFMQVNYLRSKELGFNKEQVIIVQNIWQFRDKSALKEALRHVPGVESVGASNGVLGGQNSTCDLAVKGIDVRTNANYTDVDEDFLDVAGLQLVEGRMFNASDFAAGPKAKMILNEKAVMDLGLDVDKAIGSKVTQNPFADSVVYHEVIGVVKDFHFASLRTPIMPYAFFLDSTSYNNFAVRVNTNDYEKVLADMRQAWISTGLPGPFEYFFLDEQFDTLYKTEENFELIFSVFTAISIYIACSGLFAVASYFIKRRTKEIGIRKALGATVSQVTWLVSSGFVRMVLFANLLAWPATWWIMDDWLNEFAYRIEMNWVIFAGAGIAALVIAVFTIGGQSVRAAQANPIESLRNE